jgi:ABC-type Mn2+/Zn2+ transport system permease subunit
MKKRKGIVFVLFPVIITLALYLVFYSRIECKPNDASFWFILTLGMSLGVALTQFIQRSKANKTDAK